VTGSAQSARSALGTSTTLDSGAAARSACFREGGLKEKAMQTRSVVPLVDDKRRMAALLYRSGFLKPRRRQYVEDMEGNKMAPGLETMLQQGRQHWYDPFVC